MENLIHMTAAYSNAVLLLVLTNVCDFAKRLELPIAQPITINQVRECKPSPFKNYVAGALILTNGDQFTFDNGYIAGFYAYSNYCHPPQDWQPQDYYKATNWWGTMNMTTNEVVEFARDSLRKLSYDPKVLHADGPPTQFEGPPVLSGQIVPCCRVEWSSRDWPDIVSFCIDGQRTQVLRFSLASTNAYRPTPKLDVVPELESDYRKRVQGKMFMRTNAAPRLIRPKPSSQDHD